MEISVKCPCCGIPKTVDSRHEWPTLDGRRALQLVLTGQNINIDGGKLERLKPRADDGQELKISAEYMSDRELLLTIHREPRPDGAGKASAEQAEVKRTRADMETEAAELSLKVDKKWDDNALAVAISKHKAKLAEGPK